MTETDASRRPLVMPEKFIPYLEKHRIFKLFKDMLQDLIINLPNDHLKHMKAFIHRRYENARDVNNVLLLVSPKLKIDVSKLINALTKEFGFSIITRRYIMDHYENHDNFIPGCLSSVLLSEVTKLLIRKDPVCNIGWLMFDHPRTVREARCLQQDGVLPTVTLALMQSVPDLTTLQNYQDFEGLKFVYKATLKEVLIKENDNEEIVSVKCIKAIRACPAGAQVSGQGVHVIGAPGVYRVLIIGPRGSGRKTQAMLTAKHFELIYLNFEDLYLEILRREENVEKKTNYQASSQIRTEIVLRRIAQRDCIDHGWVMTGFPCCAQELEQMDASATPPNRIIILKVDALTCKARISDRGVDWCTGRVGKTGQPRVFTHPKDTLEVLENELEVYFIETLQELRSVDGINPITIDGSGTIDEVQTKIQAAIMAAPI